jgi:nicotinamidase-related amidase
MSANKTALIVIDVQNDYFPDGRYPLWNTAATLDSTVQALDSANAAGVPVILIQHVAAATSPLFAEGSEGVAIHPRIRAAAPLAPVVVKTQADSFIDTTLEATLQELGVDELLVCGMMTQNCVTHTAISTSAAKYKVSVLSDCCTTVDQMIHQFAVNALAPRVRLLPAAQALA